VFNCHLITGTGESGKSTFSKQLKILHMSGFTNEELEHYKSVLHSNIMAGIATLIDQASKLGYTINPDLNVSITSVFSMLLTIFSYFLCVLTVLYMIVNA
jgi:hypothetical protein